MSIRKQIKSFEGAISRIPGSVHGDTQLCPLKHEFADNVYVRTIKIPKGMIVIGKIHRHSHPNFLVKGDVTVITEDGGMERIQAPRVMISAKGTKRIVFTHADTEWTTVHVVGRLRNLQKIENVVISKTYRGIPISKKAQAAIGRITAIERKG